jgi:hypothetical protein
MAIKPGHGISALAVCAIAMAILFVGVAAAVHNAGMMEVHVAEQGGDNIHIVFPAFIAQVALAFVPSSVFGDIDDEMQQWIPLLEESAKQLSAAPDFTLVQVESRDETVNIIKKGDTLVIDVQSDDDEVHVTVPLGLVERTVRKIKASRFDI